MSKYLIAVNLSFSFRTPSTSWLESGTTINRGNQSSIFKGILSSTKEKEVKTWGTTWRFNRGWPTSQITCWWRWQAWARESLHRKSNGESLKKVSILQMNRRPRTSLKALHGYRWNTRISSSLVVSFTCGCDFGGCLANLRTRLWNARLNTTASDHDQEANDCWDWEIRENVLDIPRAPLERKKSKTRHQTTKRKTRSPASL